MAIRKRPHRNYEVYWNNPFTGKRESLTVATEEEARKQDALKKYQLRFERERFRPVVEQEAAPAAHTLEGAYYLYLKEKQFSKGSLGWSLTSMKIALQMLGSKPLDEITAGDLLRVKHALEALAIKPVTVRGRLSVLRTVLRWCHANGMLEDMPRFPQLPAAIYEHIVPPTQAELAALWEASPPHVQRVIVLGAYFGARVGPSEMFKLVWQDVDFPQRLVRIPSSEKNKREPWREVPIREEILPLMQRWQASDFVLGDVEYVVHFRGKPVTTIRRSWTNAIHAAGLRYFSPYSLRHTFATSLLAAGVDAGTVARLMGHTSPTMVFTHYQHVIDSQKRRAIAALPALPCGYEHVDTHEKSPHA